MSGNLLALGKGKNDNDVYIPGVGTTVYAGLMLGMLFYHSMIFTASTAPNIGSSRSICPKT